MYFRSFLICVCVLTIATPGFAETDTPQSFAVAQVISGEELVLKDGRGIKLTGIKAPSGDTQELAEKARGALETLIAGRPVMLEDAAADRYGRVASQVYVSGGKGRKIWLQGEMLRAGMAFVYPPAGSETHLAEMLALEAAARKAKLGIWADPAYADTDAGDAWKKEGSFAFVRGEVVDIAQVKDKTYIHFGPDWHTCFTMMIAAHDLHNFSDANIDPLTLKGKTIRVRGWVMKDYGPMIEATDPGQMEVISSPLEREDRKR